MERSGDRLQALLSIVSTINSSLDPARLFENVMETARLALRADASSLILEDRRRGELFFVSSTGRKGEEVRKVRLPSGVGIGGWVIGHGEAVRLADAENDPRHDRTVARMTGYQTKAMLCVPIRLHGDVLGALQVLNALERDEFSAVDQSYLEAISMQVAYALQNSRFYLEIAHENQRLRKQLGLRQTIVGNSSAIVQLRELLTKIAPTDCTVIVTGESGTGKELVARAIHEGSRRHNGPFVPINCAALPENLIESELFGHVKGAFTGAITDRIGKFQFAEGGTLFLDEIGDMPSQAQASLLRVLQERTVQPVGSNRSVPIDVRVIAATNKKILKAIKLQQFRGDLFYRLSEFHLDIPPLRERIEDIPPLVEHVLRECERMFEREGLRLSGEALRLLSDHRWPGNVRELINVLRRSILLKDSRDSIIAVDDLPPALRDRLAARRARAEETPDDLTLDCVEHRHIDKILTLVRGNKSKAAQMLGISRPTLDRKLKQRPGEATTDPDA